MSTQHGSLSEQARRRLAAGDLIQRGFDDDEITQSSLSSVRRWRKKVEENGLQGLARHGNCKGPKLPRDEAAASVSTDDEAGKSESVIIVGRWWKRRCSE